LKHLVKDDRTPVKETDGTEGLLPYQIPTPAV